MTGYKYVLTTTVSTINNDDIPDLDNRAKINGPPLPFLLAGCLDDRLVVPNSSICSVGLFSA
jgi:hypothetical protein